MKVIGIVLIVISHVIGSLRISNSYVDNQRYMVDLSVATTNVQYLMLTMLQYSGELGNTIFFVCSCWFLLDSKKSNKRKMLQMILDIWILSMLILIIMFVLRDGDIGHGIIIMSIFPTTFSVHWYLTCYLLFYAMHPVLNKIIYRMEQRAMLRCTFVLVFLYVICNFAVKVFINDSLFFTSSLIVWVTIYFWVAYMKLYLKNMSSNIKYNIAFVAIGLIGNITLVWITNWLGLRIDYFKDKLLLWDLVGNPFIILMVIGLFNIAKQVKFNNRIINYISGLSLFIYIIHENQILRLYYRPLIWGYIYDNWGYDYIIAWMFVLVMLIFTFGLLASILYKVTIQKITKKIGDAFYPMIVRLYLNVEQMLLQIH